MTDTASPDPSIVSDLPAPFAEGTGRFRPRTGLLRTIGSELISSEVVAVIELVRNCYDADATVVDLVFSAPEDPESATLSIRDNGHGMSKTVLLGPWLEPATDHKSGRGKPGSTAGERSPRGRRRLGSKGVGRFATQRLGSVLEVCTRTADSPHELVARFNWRDLEKNAYLDEVRIPWREVMPSRVHAHGTHLDIRHLRDRWTPERFDRLRLGLTRLVSPEARADFVIRLVINGAPEDVEAAIDVDAAMYSIHGDVDASGHARVEYSDINGDREVWERSLFWPGNTQLQCGPFAFRLNAWDLDRGPLDLFLESTSSKLGVREFRRLVRDHSGISLYRDGFRILPYGEAGNDWLRLDSRRLNNPTMRLSNNQILGSIHLSADGNPQLKDQTNREGLVSNEAYDHLADVVRELLGYLEVRRFAARRAMDVDWTRGVSSLPTLHDEGSDTQINRLLSQLADGSEDRDEAATLLREYIQAFRESTADAVRYYAGLATAGQMAGLVMTQLKHPIRRVKSELSLAAADLADDELTSDDLEDIRGYVRSALDQMSRIEIRLETLDPLAVGKRGRRVSLHRLLDIVTEVIEPFAPEADRLGVALDVRGDPAIELRTNRDVVHQVLANLLDNAIWHASHGDAKSPIVTVQLMSEGLSVSDNGPGIAKEHVDSIFEPHFTTRADTHGLGLTLARDLLKTIGGRIRISKLKPATIAVELVAA